MQGFSKKSQEIIDYRVAHKRLPMETVAQNFGVTRQWVYRLCKRAGVQSAYEPYEGKDFHMKGIPPELIASVKKQAYKEGLSLKLKTIQLWENYVNSIDKV
jgi:predicted DNA-binding protein YlxM (UPF0122 family)